MSRSVIFGGVWFYLWSLDLKVKRLEQEMREDSEE